MFFGLELKDSLLVTFDNDELKAEDRFIFVDLCEEKIYGNCGQ
jgi:hypothetical protein